MSRNILHEMSVLRDLSYTDGTYTRAVERSLNIMKYFTLWVWKNTTGSTPSIG